MVAIGPVETAFQRRWPQARRSNILDDALPADLEQAGGVNPALRARMRRLAEHAMLSGAQGVLFTCSAFGEAIDAAARELPIPVLKPNEAMFLAALRSGHRLGMVATFAASVASMEDEFHALAASRGMAASLETVCVPEALAATRAGDIARHNSLVASAARQLAHCDAVMLAHFSTSPALDAVQAVLSCPVLSAPDAAVDEMRRRIEGDGPSGGSAGYLDESNCSQAVHQRLAALGCIGKRGGHRRRGEAKHTPTMISPDRPDARPAISPPAPVSFWQALAFWFKLGFISFGGPAGQIAIMHTELVERRRWISEKRFLHALNYCMLLPGPEAQQL
eukprot:gene38611-50707_t